MPKWQRKEWHEKAIEAAMDADLRSIMALLLKTKTLDALAELVRQTKDDDLEDLSHYTTEPVAKKFEKAYPELAARLWRAQGLRIVNAKKSKYYNAALSNFDRAKRCFERAGRKAEGKTARSTRCLRPRWCSRRNRTAVISSQPIANGRDSIPGRSEQPLPHDENAGTRSLRRTLI